LNATGIDVRGQPRERLRVFVAASPDERGKFEAVTRAFPAAWSGTVLDVGCRSQGLRRELSGREVRYFGVDLQPPAQALANLGHGLPFRAGAFDTVVALDVLEHTDDIHGSFRELFRVARQYVVVTLPNVYYAPARLSFLAGRAPSGKYGLPLEPPPDRHRWVFSFDEAARFCDQWARREGGTVLSEGCLIGPGQGRLFGRRLTAWLPGLLAPTYTCLMAKDGAGRR
jgi:hypothetical protein